MYINAAGASAEQPSAQYLEPQVQGIARNPGVLSSIASALDSVALNPQPLPPRDAGVLSSIASALDSVALNPQPLPPRESSLSTLAHLLHSAPALSSGQLASLRADSLAARGIIVVGG